MHEVGRLGERHSGGPVISPSSGRRWRGVHLLPRGEKESVRMLALQNVALTPSLKKRPTIREFAQAGLYW